MYNTTVGGGGVVKTYENLKGEESSTREHLSENDGRRSALEMRPGEIFSPIPDTADYNIIAV